MNIGMGDAIVQMAQDKHRQEQRRKAAEQSARFGRTIQAVADATRPDDPAIPPEYEVLVKELGRQVSDLYRQFTELDAELWRKRHLAARKETISRNRQLLAAAERDRTAADEALTDLKRKVRALEDRRDEAGRLAVEDAAAYERARGQVSPAEEKRLLSEMKSSIMVAQEAEKALSAALPGLDVARESLEEWDREVREAKAALDRAQAYAKTPISPAEPSMLTISLFALDMQADPDIWDSLDEGTKRRVSRYLQPKVTYWSPEMEEKLASWGMLNRAS